MQQLSEALKQKDLLKSHLAINSNTMSTKNYLCIHLLKVAATVICKGICVEGIAASTYTMLPFKP